MRSVRFLRWHGCYNRGTIAGFPESTAKWLVDHGKAEYYDADAPSVADKAPPKRSGATEKMVKKGF